MAAEIKLKKRMAGFYVTEDGQRAIIQTDWEGEGPRGGTLHWWELATKDAYGEAFTIDGYGGYRTLREAKVGLVERMNASA